MKKDIDYVKEMVEYLRKNLKKGYTKESLKWALVNQGHSKREVEKAMLLVEREMVHQAPMLKTKPQISHEVVEPALTHKKKSFWKRLFGD